MGNTNSRNFFNKFLQNSYSQNISAIRYTFLGFREIVSMLPFPTGIMLIELKQNQKALEIFSRLSHLYPTDATFVRQAELLQQHIQKHSQQKTQNETTTQN